MTLLAEGVRGSSGRLGHDRRAGRRPVLQDAESAAAPETREGDLHWLPLKRAVVIDPALHWGAGAVDELDTELAAARSATACRRWLSAVRGGRRSAVGAGPG